MNNVSMFDFEENHLNELFGSTRMMTSLCELNAVDLNGTQQSRILRHLRSGKPIDPHQARALYAVWHLSPIISKLRRMEHLNIGKTRHKDQSGTTYLSYFLINEDENARKSEPDIDGLEGDQEVSETAVDPDPKPQWAPGGTTTANITNVRIGRDGPELLLVCDGETENKPFIKLNLLQAEYIVMNLKVFIDAARGR